MVGVLSISSYISSTTYTHSTLMKAVCAILTFSLIHSVVCLSGQAQTKPISPVVATSKVAFTINEKDAHIESIAYDPRSKSFFLGAIHKRKILRVQPNGQVSDFIPEGQDSLYSVLGLQVDAKRNRLWVCGTALPQMNGYAEADKGKAAVYLYDLTKKRLLSKYTLPADGHNHILGEPLVAANGDVYISDSGYPSIYRIRNGSDVMELLLFTKLRSLQGMAFSPDEKTLFVADYSLGIHRLDMASGQLTKLTRPDSLQDRGTDGLYFYKNRLIAIQNGITPSRVVSFALDDSLTKITGVAVLEMKNPNFNEPTLGVIVGKELYYVANSQWSNYQKDGSIYPLDKLADILIMKTDLR